MSFSIKQKLLLLMIVLLPIFVLACSFLYPPEIRYQSILHPVLQGDDPSYTLDEETESIVFDLG